MSSKSLLRVSYWIGVIADLVVAIAMVYPPMMARMFSLDRVPDAIDAKVALYMGASLMFGWVVLLIWADRKPFERKGILLITVFPVIVGLASAVLNGYLTGFVPLKGAIPVWVLQVLLTTLFLSSYFYARASKQGNAT